MENFEEAQSKYGRIYKVAGPCKYSFISIILTFINLQWSSVSKCQEQKCTSSSKLDGTSWSVRSSSLRVTLPQFSAMRIPVSHCLLSILITSNMFLNIAGLTVGDPILRTGNPLSVELGPGKLIETLRFFLIVLFNINYIN